MLAPPSDPPTTIGHMDSSEAVADSLHASMVLDFERNAAFARGLRLSLEQLHLQPDRRPAGGLKVLDIGTGSGLLALLAARVAPPGVVSEVVACEAVPLVAAAAQRVVRDNPPGEASCTSGSRHPAPVRVLAKRSTSLLPNRHLGGPADLLVTELLDNEMVGEGLLAVVRDARRRGLLKPGAPVVPARATLYMQLVAVAPSVSASFSCAGAQVGVGPAGETLHFQSPTLPAHGSAIPCHALPVPLSVQVNSPSMKGKIQPLTLPWRALSFDLREHPERPWFGECPGAEHPAPLYRDIDGSDSEADAWASQTDTGDTTDGYDSEDDCGDEPEFSRSACVPLLPRTPGTGGGPPVAEALLVWWTADLFLPDSIPIPADNEPSMAGHLADDDAAFISEQCGCPASEQLQRGCEHAFRPLRISTAPEWAASGCPDALAAGPYPWRDHWTQILCPLARPFPLAGDEAPTSVTLGVWHNAWAMWADARPGADPAPASDFPPAGPGSCHCRLHHRLSRERIAQLNLGPGYWLPQRRAAGWALDRATSPGLGGSRRVLVRADDHALPLVIVAAALEQDFAGVIFISHLSSSPVAATETALAAAFPDVHIVAGRLGSWPGDVLADGHPPGALTVRLLPHCALSNAPHAAPWDVFLQEPFLGACQGQLPWLEALGAWGMARQALDAGIANLAPGGFSLHAQLAALPELWQAHAPLPRPLLVDWSLHETPWGRSSSRPAPLALDLAHFSSVTGSLDSAAVVQGDGWSSLCEAYALGQYPHRLLDTQADLGDTCPNPAVWRVDFSADALPAPGTGATLVARALLRCKSPSDRHLADSIVFSIRYAGPGEPRADDSPLAEAAHWLKHGVLLLPPGEENAHAIELEVWLSPAPVDGDDDDSKDVTPQLRLRARRVDHLAP
ncbi:hypothetical protein H696_03149 [Fonticula alba]|uniref:Protein arginine N-methyltransferase n=1 Tax=Fonticula alba TaxID=691883 RepID=A0A058ZA35_FONAL|nr:hypothetical protein H696_03149 [Fonticula alba]KCV70798.1 hypothetical protein H696_03149 [Fonticula alba]|eukprot:XP_009495314.1 hypothetical protein H696_03149 [Fonticula alba]